MAEIAFGTDGVRGRAHEEVNEDVAFRVGAAIAEDTPNIVLVRDTRPYNEELAEALKEGFASKDGSVHDFGILPTPAAAILANMISKSGSKKYAAVSLSASHNPAEDVGIKVFGIGGAKLSDNQTGLFAARANRTERSIIRPVNFMPKTPESFKERGRNRYVDAVVSTLPEELLRDKFLDGQRILVDAANGAAHWSAREVLERFGAKVETIFDDPTANINEGCGAEHPDAMAEEAAKRGLMGLSLDGDADRLIAFNEGILTGDDAIMIAIRSLDRVGQLRRRVAVATRYSNFGLGQALAREGVRLEEVDNGDKYVARGMKETEAQVGAEQSGHALYAEAGHRLGVLVGDGTVTALQILAAPVIAGQSLAELSDWPKAEHKLTNIELPKGVDAKVVLGRVASHIDTAKARFGESGDIHIRASGTASGTNPIIRSLVRGGTPESNAEVSGYLSQLITDAA